jgi:mRNA-degrading endonuclease RelE of RelBE toxin-antitoxin system
MFIQWTNSAFAELENLPQEIAFEIIRQTDFLINFPEMGSNLESRFSRLKGLKQLIIKRNWRIVYDFDDDEKTVFILAMQNCRQELPPMRDLKRRKR